MIENDTYQNFFEEMKKLRALQKKQKQRGLNDYNILTTVLSADDEVRVHSRMIESLLNINGKHYQDDLFLKIFLKVVQINGYSTVDSKIYKEYENIDLYLTDGNKHIIIENKVWAKDQFKQIEKYVDLIKKENEKLPHENLYVIYLSIDRDSPSDESLGRYKIDNEYIVNKDDNEKIAIYKAMHYKSDILSWLKECQYEVQNITNLNEVLKQYIDVVQLITNQYKGKVMSILTYIKELENSDLKREYIEILDEVNDSYQEEKLELKKEFFTKNIGIYLKDYLPKEYLDWNVEYVGEEKDMNKAYGVEIRFFKGENWKIVYILRFDASNMKKLYWTIAKIDDKINLTEMKKKIKPISPHKQTNTSLLWSYSECDLDENFLKLIDNKDELYEMIIKEFMMVMEQLKNKYGYTLETINIEINK
jgi:hypothetical protein